MDYGDGEVRLVRRKGKKRPPPPAPPAERGERDRLDELRRDYRDVFKDNEMKRRKLESINKRKLVLLAEVKFLQKKLDSFKKDDSQQACYRLKKKAPRVPSHVGSNDASAYYGASTEVPSTSKRTNLDLNQDSAMNDELSDYPGHRNHLELKRAGQAGVDEDIMTSDVNLSACRDTGNSPVSDDKRSVSWQDRLALKQTENISGWYTVAARAIRTHSIQSPQVTLFRILDSLSQTQRFYLLLVPRASAVMLKLRFRVTFGLAGIATPF
uniref:Uncharacterized protein n=1 Tax=Oryza punctata TaxID=4537 RepID=A0A0E0M1C5_ORYPU